MEKLKPFLNGVIPDTPDERDFLYEKKVGGGEPFDWNKGYDVEEEISAKLGKPTKLKVESQNGSLSCVGQGTSKYVEVLNVFDEGVLPDLSAKDIYQSIYLPGGCAMVRDAMDFVVNKGVDYEEFVPSYEKGKAPSEAYMEKVLPRNDERAKKFKAMSYLTTTHNDFDFMAMMIRDNHGFVSSYVGSNSGWSAKILTPPKTEDFGHCVYFGKARISYGKKQLGFINSGGTKIGEKGWQWIEENYLSYLKNIWALRDLLTNQENMIVDEAKLNQIYNELLLRSPKPEEYFTGGYIGKDEEFVRSEVGKSEERQKLITLVNAAKNL